MFYVMTYSWGLNQDSFWFCFVCFFVSFVSVFTIHLWDMGFEFESCGRMVSVERLHRLPRAELFLSNQSCLTFCDITVCKQKKVSCELGSFCGYIHTTHLHSFPPLLRFFTPPHLTTFTCWRLILTSHVLSSSRFHAHIFIYITWVWNMIAQDIIS